MAKNQKNFEFGKIRKHEEIMLKKKRFNSFKRHLYHNGKAEKILMVAGRLVNLALENHFSSQHKYSMIKSSSITYLASKMPL